MDRTVSAVTRPRENCAAYHRGQTLSVVVPCFDEEAVICETHRRLTTVLGEVPDLDFELVYVDDGSRDATLDVLRTLQSSDARVRVIALSRNFGHQIALSAGLAEANGDAIGIIDADLQDPPEVLLRMLERWRDGVDVVYGLRSVREGETAFKRYTANAFYRLFNSLADDAISFNTGDFRLMDRKVVDAFLRMPERDRFVRGMVAWTGFRPGADPLYPCGASGGRDQISTEENAPPCDGRHPLLHLRTVASGGLDGLFRRCPGPCRRRLRLRRSLGDQHMDSRMGHAVRRSPVSGRNPAYAHRCSRRVRRRTYREVKRRPLYLVKERLGFPPAADSPFPEREGTESEQRR